MDVHSSGAAALPTRDITWAQWYLSQVWSGRRKPDQCFREEALPLLGMSSGQFEALARQARSVTRGRPSFVLPTPTGSGRNR